MNPALTRIFTWKPRSIVFTALTGHQSENYPPGLLIDRWAYFHNPASGHYVPAPGRETVRLNLWLNNSPPVPATNEPIEVVITDFSFTPAPSVAGDFDGDGAADLALFRPEQWGLDVPVLDLELRVGYQSAVRPEHRQARARRL